MDGDEEQRRLAASLDQDAVAMTLRRLAASLVEEAVARTAQMADRSFVQAQLDGIRKDLYELQNKIWPGGSGGTVDLVGAFAPEFEEGTEDEPTGERPVARLVNCYYQVGGSTRKLSDFSVPSNANGIAALKIDATTEDDRNAAQIQFYELESALETAQADAHYMIIPLYRFSNGCIAADMRNMPTFPMGEVLS